MTVWERNLEALKKQQPYFVEKLAEKKWNIDGSSKIKVLPELARDNSPILVACKEDKQYFLNSRFRPKEEAEKYAKQFDEVKDYSVLCFFGFGNGDFARAIEKRGSDLVRFAFYEPSLESFLYVLEHYDLSDLFSSDKITIYVVGINDLELAAYLPDMVDWVNLPLLNIYCLPQYEKLFDEDYLNFVKVIRDVSARAQMGMNTIVAYASYKTRNTIQHLRYIFKANSANDFKNLFPKEMPAILISAGPSLKKNIEVLKQAKNHAFLLAVDTAIKILYENDIIPDGIIGVDPVKYRAHMPEYQERYQKSMWITKLDGCCDMTDRLHARRNVFINGEDDYHNEIYKKYGKTLPDLATGGSVANTAFSLLELWGFSTIIMVGQDLALTGNQRHSGFEGEGKGAYQDSIDKGFTLIETEGYDGETVITREDYFSYLKWFEGAVSISKVPHLINATEGGAMIKGMEQMTLKDALSQYAKKEYDVLELIDQIPTSFDEKQQEEIHKLVDEFPAKLHRLEQKFRQGMQLTERGKTLVLRPNYDLKEYNQIQKKLSKIDQEVSNEIEYTTIAIRASEVERTIARRRVVDEDGEFSNDAAVFEGMHELYKGFLDATIEIEELMEDVVLKIEEEGMR